MVPEKNSISEISVQSGLKWSRSGLKWFKDQSCQCRLSLSKGKITYAYSFSIIPFNKTSCVYGYLIISICIWYFLRVYVGVEKEYIIKYFIFRDAVTFIWLYFVYLLIYLLIDSSMLICVAIHHIYRILYTEVLHRITLNQNTPIYLTFLL